ncbi:MAG TPA: hypothetical protein VKU38_13325 [Ktedonobacteraceae bacterium]|nr:hypothetical protein [Ktedonobacteraceae bacterium]
MKSLDLEIDSDLSPDLASESDARRNVRRSSRLVRSSNEVAPIHSRATTSSSYYERDIVDPTRYFPELEPVLPLILHCHRTRSI